MGNSFEQTVGKIAGAAKQGVAKVKGLKGVFATLSKEHGEAWALLKRLQMSQDPEVRGRLFPEVRRELLSHERGELAEVYPRLNEHEELREIVAKHQDEASEIERAIADVSAINTSSPGWAGTFDNLVTLVQRHVREEEQEFFPKAMRIIGDDEAEAMQERYMRAKQAAAEET